MTWLLSQAMMKTFSSLPSSQGQAAEYSAENCSDGEPFAPLSVMPTPHKFWRNDKTMEFLKLSQFGLTCAVLEPTTQIAQTCLQAYAQTLIASSSAAVFPAKIFPSQEKAQDLQAQEADYGASSRVLLASYDPATHSLKTAQCSLFEDSMSCSATLPKWGSMQSGACFLRPMLAQTIKESVFGFSLATGVGSDATSGAIIGKNDQFYQTATGMPRKVNQNGTDGSVGLARLVQMWPTPSAQESGVSVSRLVDKDGLAPTHINQRIYDKETGRLAQKGLTQAVQMWPTATVNGNHNRKGLSKTSGDGLATAVKKCGTPKAQDSRHAKTDRGKFNLGEQVAGIHDGGDLNPDWVEWLMGWPIYWTSLQSLAEPNFCTDANWWKVEPAIPRTSNDIKHRVDRLKAIGNGQVPLCATTAFTLLSERLDV